MSPVQDPSSPTIVNDSGGGGAAAAAEAAVSDVSASFLPAQASTVTAVRNAAKRNEARAWRMVSPGRSKWFGGSGLKLLSGTKMHYEIDFRNALRTTASLRSKAISY